MPKSIRLASLSLVTSILCVASCGPGITASSGAAACIAASNCQLFGVINASSCTQGVSTINDPAFGLLVEIESPLGGASVRISPSQVNCIANAGSDCTRAKACLDNGMTPAACSGSSATCMGNFVLTCSTAAGSNGNSGQSLFDCSTLGPGYTCVASNGNVDCGTASCGGGNPTQCMGNVLQGCRNGIMKQVDCAHFASTCVTAGLQAHCRGTGPACTTRNNGDTTVRCDGSVLVDCADGQEARYDCGQLGLGCFPNPDGNGGFGCFAGNACNPSQFTSTCSGNTLQFCNKGKIDTFNCAGSGFTSCNAQAGTCTK